MVAEPKTIAEYQACTTPSSNDLLLAWGNSAANTLNITIENLFDITVWSACTTPASSDLILLQGNALANTFKITNENLANVAQWSACTTPVAADILLLQGNALANTFKITITALDTTLAGKKSKWIPVRDMIPATTAGALPAQLETATQAINFEVLDFIDASDTYAHFNFSFGNAWNLGTVTYQVYWSSVAVDTDGVGWGLQAVSVGDSVTPDTAFGTPIVVTDNAQSTASEVYVSAESAVLTIGNTPADGDIVYFRIFRDVDDAADTMTENARLIGVKVFFTEDTLVDT